MMDSKGKTADHYLRAQTIQNYDFMSPLNGELASHKPAEQNGIDGQRRGREGRRATKGKIKPVSKASKGTKTNGDIASESATETSDASADKSQNSETTTSATDMSSLAPMLTQPSNRLPALKSEESIEAESRQNQNQLDAKSDNNGLSEQKVATDQSKDELNPVIPSAPTPETTEIETETEATDEDRSAQPDGNEVTNEQAQGNGDDQGGSYAQGEEPQMQQGDTTSSEQVETKLEESTEQAQTEIKESTEAEQISKEGADEQDKSENDATSEQKEPEKEVTDEHEQLESSETGQEEKDEKTTEAVSGVETQEPVVTIGESISDKESAEAKTVEEKTSADKEDQKEGQDVAAVEESVEVSKQEKEETEVSVESSGQKIEENETQSDNESQMASNNEEKRVDIISDNQVYSEANEESATDGAQVGHRDGSDGSERRDGNRQEASETPVIDKASERSADEDLVRAQSGLNDRQRAEQSEAIPEMSQTIEARELAQTSDTSDTNVGINEENLQTNGEQEKQSDAVLTNIEANEESMKTDAIEAVETDETNETNAAKETVVLDDSQVVSQSDEQIKAKQTNDSNQNIQNNETKAESADHKGLSEDDSASSEASDKKSSATSRSLSGTDSQQTVVENKPVSGRRPSESVSRQQTDSEVSDELKDQSSPEDNNESESVVRPESGDQKPKSGGRRPESRHSAKNSRPQTSEEVRRESGAENGLGKVLLGKADASEEVGEQVANDVISQSITAIKEGQSEQSQSGGEIDGQKADESQPKPIGDVEEKTTEEDAQRDNEIESSRRQEANEADNGKSDSKRVHTMTGNEVVADSDNTQTNDSKDTNDNQTTATADVKDSSGPVMPTNEDRDVTQISDSNNEKRDNENQNIVDEENTEVKTDANADGKSDANVTEEINADIINGNTSVTNDQNNNVQKKEEVRSGSVMSNSGRMSSQLERAFSRQSTVSNINPQPGMT